MLRGDELSPGLSAELHRISLEYATKKLQRFVQAHVSHVSMSVKRFKESPMQFQCAIREIAVNILCIGCSFCEKIVTVADAKFLF